MVRCWAEIVSSSFRAARETISWPQREGPTARAVRLAAAKREHALHCNVGSMRPAKTDEAIQSHREMTDRFARSYDISCCQSVRLISNLAATAHIAGPASG